MRITTLRLKNFRSHVETKLELDRFNFVRGPNGCGKSSIQMALEYLFTGRCELTDAAGRGAEALIRVGEKGLEVSATLESGETICRKRTARAQAVEINGKRVPVDAAGAFLAKRFGSPDALSAVLNSGRFVQMAEAEQKRFLAHMVDAGKVDIPGEIEEALRTIEEEPPRIASAGDVEAAHEHFCSLRAEAVCARNALREPQTHVRERTNLGERIHLLDTLIEFFGSNRTMRDQSGGGTGLFTEQLNRNLAGFGSNCTISLEPLGIRLSLGEDTRSGLCLTQLSQSEQFRFGVAFQIALAMAARLGFVVIDRGEVLDKEEKRRLTRLLLQSGLDQAVVLATSEETEPANLPHGVRFIDLTNRNSSGEVFTSAAD